MYVLWALLFATFPLVEVMVYPKAFYACWVLMLFFVMSGHYVLIQGAVGRLYGKTHLSTIYACAFLATVCSMLFKAPITPGDITFSSTLIVDPRSARITGIMSTNDVVHQFNIVYLSCAGLCIVGKCIADPFVCEALSKCGFADGQFR